jgi:type IV pilus assembly protein PilM
MNIISAVTGFFNDITHFVSVREVLGIDIGTVAIKIAHLKRSGEVLTLENYGILETREYLGRGNAAIQTSSLKIVEKDATALISTLVREIGAPTLFAVASIPMFGIFTVVIEIPLVSPEETGKLLSFQARQYIPVPLEQVSLDWVKIAEFEHQRDVKYQRLLITAIPLSIVKSYQSIFKAAGLKLLGLETEMQALMRSLLGPNDPATLILDIGAESSSIAVVERGVVKQAGQSDYGGASLTQAIARNLGISLWRAEELKRRRGLLGGLGEYDLSTSLAPFLDVIIQECGRVKLAYEKTGGSPIERLMPIGGGANLPGLAAYLTSQTGLKVQTPYPFAQVHYPTAVEPLMKSLSNELSVAVGLAKKPFAAQGS